MLPADYRLRSMREADYSAIAEICARVYPADTPYTVAELAEHHRRFPEGQVVAEHVPTAAVAGATTRSLSGTVSCNRRTASAR